VIVDEAQDCGEDELAVLAFLRDAGVTVTLVADRDQAIFEFRRATPHQLDSFVKTLTPGQPLDGNFRSSPAVCALNDCLRSGTETDKPMGRNVGVVAPIQLVEYRNFEELPALIRASLAQHDLAEHDVVVLAHKRNHARQAAGSAAATAVGAQKVMRVAEASRLMRAKGADAKTVFRATATAERLLLERLEGHDLAQTTVDTMCESLGIERRWLREAAVRTLMAADPDQCDRTQYSARLQTVVESLSFPSHLIMRPVTQYLRTPSVDQWGKLGTPSQEVSLAWATVHSVKGQEFPAVALVIPDSRHKGDDGLTAVDHWEAGTDAEARRVLYVGASRAEKLLILGVHAAQHSRVKTILERGRVPLETGVHTSKAAS
jgi:ATP-dependent exoDNAse (exonuclease V) beta subunit